MRSTSRPDQADRHRTLTTTQARFAVRTVDDMHLPSRATYEQLLDAAG